MTTVKQFLFMVISVVVAAVCAAGCASTAKDPEVPTPAGWPPGWDKFSFVWTAEPGIDVTTQPVVAARAYVESFQLAYLLSNDKYLYPGFTGALDPQPASDPGGQPVDLQPWTGRAAERPWIGTERNHVLSVAPMDGGTAIVLCQYTYAVGSLERVGDRYSTQDGGQPGTEKGGITPMRIIVKAPASPQPSQVPEQGPARTPSNDVFGGYRIIDASGGYIGPHRVLLGWPEYDGVEATCVDKAPDSMQWRKQFTESYHKINDFPVLPPTPGWPVNPAN